MPSLLLLILTLAAKLVIPIHYITLENDKIPLKYVRSVQEDRDDNTTIANGTHVVNNAPDNPFEGIDIEGELSWVKEALKDIAHYLRAHKFNEYDRRYETKPDNATTRDYYQHFPKPPLRSLHWEVRKFCEPSFLTCVEYLNKKVKNVNLRREDDTTVAMQEQKWTLLNNSEQVNTIDAECRKLLKIDNERADPFEGPIERYQWRTTASYYMCWYTMNGVPNLASLNDTCDNFAACIDVRFGPRNKDPRADEGKPFACALYSFCPDPCCPLKHITEFSECWQEKLSPCYAINSFEYRQCKFRRADNVDFTDLVLNRFNVSCHCKEKGFEYDARYAICVDVDECVAKTHNCNGEREACLNTKGGFVCVCKWGFYFENGVCRKSAALDMIKKQKAIGKNDTKHNIAGSVVKKVYQFVVGKITGHHAEEEHSNK